MRLRISFIEVSSSLPVPTSPPNPPCLTHTPISSLPPSLSFPAPANTEEVKQLGLEAGKLQEELHPKDLRVRLEENLCSVKDILNSNKYYTNMVNDPEHGQQYKKAYEILLQKIAIFDQIESDYKENNKSVEKLQTELDNLLK